MGYRIALVLATAMLAGCVMPGGLDYPTAEQGANRVCPDTVKSKPIAEVDATVAKLWEKIFGFEQAVRIGGWGYGEQVDDLTDERYATAFSTVTRADENYIGIICSGDRLGALVKFSEFLNSADELVPVRYRVDKGELHKSHSWKAMSSHDTAYVSKGRALFFANTLLNGNRVLVEATSYDGARHRVKVPLDGASEAVCRVLQFCGL